MTDIFDTMFPDPPPLGTTSPAATGDIFDRMFPSPAADEGITAENHIRHAGAEIRSLEGQGQRVPALAKQAIVDEWRQRAGMTRILGTDHYKEGLAFRNERNPFANFASACA